MRRASLTWHTIWCADIRPQRWGFCGCTVPSLRRILALSRGRAGVFTPRLSPTEEALSARLAEREERALAPRFGLPQEPLESGMVAEGVEVGEARQGGRDDVALGDRLLQMAEPLLVRARITGQPALLEHGLRVVLDLQVAETGNARDHFRGTPIEPRLQVVRTPPQAHDTRPPDPLTHSRELPAARAERGA